MKTRIGSTRIVFLINDKAIKFGRIRIIRFVLRLLFYPFMPKGKNKLFYQDYGKYPLFGMVKYLSVGINANRKEYKYYKKTKDKRVVPTLKIFLSGWVIVQKRGLNISSTEFYIHNLFSGVPFFSEKYEPWQFCKIGNRVCLVDYGREEVYHILMRNFLKA